MTELTGKGRAAVQAGAAERQMIAELTDDEVAISRDLLQRCADALEEK